MECRAAAARCLGQIAHRGRSLPVALAEVEPEVSERDRSLLRELIYGSLRYYPRLLAMLDLLLNQPLKKRDSDLEALMIVGAYQLLYTRVPPHAAVDSVVRACRELQRPWAKGLVNGVMRQLQARHSQLEPRLRDAALAAHPDWLYECILEAWPDQATGILAANNEQPPFTVRVNLSRCSRDEYHERLSTAGLDATVSPHSEAGLQLARAVDVNQLPGFAEGDVSVQDEAAQLAASLLAPQAGERVLDACAAPGGKSAHLLESTGGKIELLALDNDAERLRRVESGLQRLGTKASLTCADAGDTAAWWDSQPFQRILLDAPCSGTGVIRRHPDIKLLRRAGDPGKLAAQQRRLLDALWPTLAPGGRLLYATCSVLPVENTRLIESFAGDNADVEVQPITASWGVASGPGRQLLPAPGGPDGFFYALLGKAAAHGRS